jgi:2,4'-dihydroxyacetophenone dioxygenase
MLPKHAPKFEELLAQSESLPWREKSLKGISEKMLWREKKLARQLR